MPGSHGPINLKIWTFGKSILQWLNRATDGKMFNVYFKSISTWDSHPRVFKNIFIWIETVVHCQTTICENIIIWITTSLTGVGQTLRFLGSWIWLTVLPTSYFILLIQDMFANAVKNIIHSFIHVFMYSFTQLVLITYHICWWKRHNKWATIKDSRVYWIQFLRQ